MSPIDLFDQIGESIPNAKRGKMFGEICYKLGRRPFIYFSEEEIICKLFDERKAQAMQLPGAHYFAPMAPDKPMTNWVCLPFEQEEHWAFFSEAAYAFVEAGR